MKLDFVDDVPIYYAVVNGTSQHKVLHYKRNCKMLIRSKVVTTLSEAEHRVLFKLGYKDCGFCARPDFIIPEELKIIDDLFIPEGYRVKICYRDPNNYTGNYKTMYERGTDQV